MRLRASESRRGAHAIGTSLRGTLALRQLHSARSQRGAPRDRAPRTQIRRHGEARRPKRPTTHVQLTCKPEAEHRCTSERWERGPAANTHTEALLPPRLRRRLRRRRVHATLPPSPVALANGVERRELAAQRGGAQLVVRAAAGDEHVDEQPERRHAARGRRALCRRASSVGQRPAGSEPLTRLANLREGCESERLDEALEVGPRGGVVRRACNLRECVGNLGGDEVGGAQIAGMLEHVVPLVPRRVIAHVLLQERVHVRELAVPQREGLQDPLAVAPSVVILGILLEHGGDELELVSRLAQRRDACTPVEPHLVVLHVVEALLGAVLELLPPRGELLLAGESLAHLTDALAAILPRRVVGGVVVDGLRGEQQSPLRVLLVDQHTAEVVHHECEGLVVCDAHHRSRSIVLLDWRLVGKGLHD
mmetsp:Transcript_22042/g.56253  ORF Transcript_22042/g.56253 Transcript_22042/m.56253 type:complete len:422 (-) Transcript_22042:50-1315(-)